MDRKEVLKAMLQDVINDRMEQASVSMHDYFVSKTREVAGLGSSVEEDEPETVEEEKVEGMDLTPSETKLLSMAEKKMGRGFQAASAEEFRTALMKIAESDDEHMSSVLSLARKIRKVKSA